jgi:hypothetical protein
VVTAALLALTLAAPAGAGPEVIIRARTALQIDEVRKITADSTVIAGRLVDGLTGVGLAGEAVSIRVDGAGFRAITAPDGGFSLRIPTPASATPSATLGFAGSSHLDESIATFDRIDINKQTVDLELVVSPTATGVAITVRATADEDEVQIPVGLELETGTSQLRSLGEVRSGSARTLTASEAGGPGRHRLHAQFRGDEQLAPASAEATFELAVSPRITFDLRDHEVAFEARVEGRGSVTDPSGAGLPGVPVAMVAGDRRLGETRSGSDGAFALSIEAEVLGAGNHGLHAVVEPITTRMSAARSTPEVVPVAAPDPAPAGVTAAAFLATALAACGFLLARTTPWRRLRWWRREAATTTATEGPSAAHSGLLRSRPSLVATLRRPADHGFSGIVVDSIRRRPLPGAVVRLALGDLRQRCAADDAGRFSLDALPPGAWEATVTLAGHVTESFAVTVPHRGELRQARIELVAVRERIFSWYRSIAEPLLPRAELWGVWSPRQIVNHVRQSGPSPALVELTDFVEETYFSARAPDEPALVEARRRVGLAQREHRPPA